MLYPDTPLKRNTRSQLALLWASVLLVLLLCVPTEQRTVYFTCCQISKIPHYPDQDKMTEFKHLLSLF